MGFFSFLAALCLAVIAFEVASLLLGTSGQRRNLLDGYIQDREDIRDLQNLQRRPTTLEALLIVLFPKRFSERAAGNVTDVVDLLRRSGYYYPTPGHFYAAAVRDFSQYLIIGSILAVGLVILEMPVAAVPILAVYIILGLRRPYSRLRSIAKRRGVAMKNNMLMGLSVLQSLMTVSTSSQQAFTEVSKIGGPFCNLLGLLSAQMEKKSSAEAIEVVRAHLPNPNDLEADLFFKDVLAYFEKMRPILKSVTALRDSVHRLVLDSTEERAALVRQRANLFGILSIMGLLLSLILPYMGVGF